MAVSRLVVIGAGLIGREHCALILEHPEAELVGLADVSPEAKTYADSMGVPCFADYQQMLDETKPDGAIVAVPNRLHLPAGQACLSRDIACLIEKPIAETVPLARELVEASEEAEVPILVGHHRRHSPDIREAKRLIEAGALGSLVTVNGMWLADKPDDYFETTWRREPRRRADPDQPHS
ncbi:MAG: Gfo/Idh/MocA family oxidoreductase [Alphaproteobacteria bacterium]|nr:Gfo/Idh/MocA family oxidoreductase [Alphaproteobacteria bacterium]